VAFVVVCVYVAFVDVGGLHSRSMWVVTDVASFRLVGGFGGQCSCGLNCRTHREQLTRVLTNGHL